VTATDNAEKVREYFRLLDSDQFDGVAGLFHEEGTLSLPAGRPVTGRVAIAAHYKRALPGTFQKHKANIERILESEDYAVALLAVDATGLSGSSSFTFRAVDIFRFVGGEIFSLEVVLDRRRLNL
jgi:ketosteroid isomerase-like protein